MPPMKSMPPHTAFRQLLANQHVLLKFTTTTKESRKVKATTAQSRRDYTHVSQTHENDITNPSQRIQPRLKWRPTNLLAPKSRTPPSLRKRRQRRLLHRRSRRLHNPRALVRRAQPPSAQQHASHAQRRPGLFLPLQRQAVGRGRHIAGR
jgi:hypothetical protein